MSDDVPTKVCAKCGTEKSLDEFYKHSKTKDGRGSYCRPCASAYHKIYFSENAPSLKEKIVEYRRSERGRQLLSAQRKRAYARELEDKEYDLFIERMEHEDIGTKPPRRVTFSQTSQETKREIIESKLNGRDAAQFFGVTASTISRIRNEARRNGASERRWHEQIDDEVRKQIIESPLGCSAAARKHGVSPSMVSTIRNDARSDGAFVAAPLNNRGRKTAEDVVQKIKESNLNGQDAAIQFGVSEATVSKIRKSARDSYPATAQDRGSRQRPHNPSPVSINETRSLPWSPKTQNAA